MDLVPDLSFCIVARQGPEVLRATLQALHDNADHILFEVFVVDLNGSSGIAAMLDRHFPATHVLEEIGPVRRAGASNMALQLCRGRYLVLWDEDLACSPGCLQKLVAFMDDTPETGLVGPRIEEGGDRSVPQVHRFRTLWSLLVPHTGRDQSSTAAVGDVEVDWLPADALFIRREVTEEIGLLDEGYPDLYEDMDFCWRAVRAGWHVHFIPEAVVLRLPAGEDEVSSLTNPGPGGNLLALARFSRKKWLFPRR